MKQHTPPSPIPVYYRRTSGLVALLLALLLNPHELLATAPSPESANEVPAAKLERMNSVVGVVLALDDKQIGLLQFAKDGTNHQVVVYSYCAATLMPENPTMAPGESVTIAFLALPDEPPLATSVERLPAEVGATSPTASESVATVESMVPPPAIAEPSPVESPPQLNAGSPIEENSVSAELAVEEQHPPCPVDGGDSGDNERFTFGKVVQVLTNALLIREYDFSKDADVEVSYQLQLDTEYGNLSPERPLQIGDDVVLDYLDENGQRFVTTLVREEKLEEEAGPADAEEVIIAKENDLFTFGKIAGLLPQAVLVCEYDFARDADVDVRYESQKDTEYGNVTPERPLQIGDDVVVDYLAKAGQRFVTMLVREEKLVAAEANSDDFAEQSDTVPQPHQTMSPYSKSRP